MDGRTLMEIMQSPNFSMWAPAQQAFDLGQKKEQAGLQGLLGTEQRAQAMQPLDMANKQAVTRLNQSTAAMNEDSLAGKLPVEQRLDQAMREYRQKTSDADWAQTKQQVVKRLQTAAAIKANKGQLPEGLQFSPEEMRLYSPGNLDKIIQQGEAFLKYDPEEISRRAKSADAYKQAIDVANTQGKWRLDTKSAGGSGGAKPPKSPRELMSYYDFLANQSDDPQERAKYQELAQQQEILYQKELILRAQAMGAGKIDVPATAAGGTPVDRPMPTPQATSRGGAPKPGSTPDNPIILK